MKLPAFEYVKPRELGEVFDLLDQHGDDAVILAGGQSLMPALAGRLSAPAVLIDINGLDELRGIARSGGTVRVGALVRHAELGGSPEIATALPLLTQAIPHVAHAAIRNRGTFGGSVALADPAAELPACCLALGARFELASRAGNRTVRAEDFFVELYETARRDDEILIGAEFDETPDGVRCAFAELARRHGDYAIVGIAATASLTEGRLSGVRLAFLSAGSTALLARAAAAELEGREYTPEAVRRAQDALEQDISPPDDPMMSSAAKLHMAKVLLGRVARMLAGDDRSLKGDRS